MDTMASSHHPMKSTSLPYFSFEISSSALKEVMIGQQHTWSYDEDLVLFDYLNIAAKKYSSDPFSLNIIHVLQQVNNDDITSTPNIDKSSSNSSSSSGSSSSSSILYRNDDHSHANMLSFLQHKHSVEDVAVRALVLIHMNDIALPLFSLICPYSNAPMMDSDLLFDTASHQRYASLFGAYGEAPINHPTSLLKVVRELLFPLSKRDFFLRLCQFSQQRSLGDLIHPPISSVGTHTALIQSTHNSMLSGPMLSQQTSYGSINYEGGNSNNKGGAGVNNGSNNKLGGLMLQSILSSLGEEGKQYMDAEGVDVTPTDQRISKNTPFVTPYSSIPAVDLIPQQYTAYNHTSPTQQYLLADSNSSGSSSSTTAMKKMEVNTLVLGGIITSRNKYSDRGQVLLVEIYEESYVSYCIYEAAMEKGVIEQLMRIDTWRLITGFQCSFVGQFMKFIEQLGVLNANISISEVGTSLNNSSHNNSNSNGRNSKTGPSSSSSQQQQQQQSQGGNAGAWEQLLRNSIENITILWTLKTLKACDRYIPFAIRASREKGQIEAKQKCISSNIYHHHHPLSSSHNVSSSSIPDQSRFFQLLDIAEHHPEVISEWTLFSFYIEDALSQIQQIVGSLLKDDDNIAQFSANVNAAQLNIIIQIVYSVGVLIGFAFQCGVAVFFPLSNACSSILSNTALSISISSPTTITNDDMNYTIALALRNGILSVLPEPAFDLITHREMKQLLCGSFGYGPPSVALLCRHATYEPPICSNDLHVMYFWIAMYELSPQQIECFLRRVMKRHDKIEATANQRGISQVTTDDEVLYSSSSSSPSSIITLHILPPTALALLSPDICEIMVFADRRAISLPRYSSLHVMMQHIQLLSI